MALQRTLSLLPFLLASPERITMKNLRDTFFCIVVGLMFIGLVGSFCALSTRPQPIESIPSIRQIQQRLKATGKKRYDCGKVDGKFGPDTVKAWNNYTFDQFANKEFE